MTISCSCNVDVDFDGGCHDDFQTSTRRKARKVHKCHECCREIKPGENYLYISGKSEGFMFTHKVCPDCLSVKDQFFKHGWIMETLWDDLQEFIRESGYTTNEDCLAGLTPAARKMVCDFIQEGWEDQGYEE